MSLVPAMICTTAGFRSITSWRKRSSICEVVCPLIPRPIRLATKNCGILPTQPSVIESPMKTIRGCPATGAASLALSSR